MIIARLTTGFILIIFCNLVNIVICGATPLHNIYPNDLSKNADYNIPSKDIASKNNVNSLHTKNLIDEDLPITIDNRIKTYVYNANEIYLLVLHFGFQSHIEFAKGEEIETISLGDTYAWKLTPLGNRLFIKPMEKNIRTNMTIITNKRTYQFDLVAKELTDDDETDLVYLVRFYYPRKK